MSSNSLIRWNGERAEALDEIENAHASVGGTGRGRRYATQQINYAYTTLLSSHFQGFCRDLHSECLDHVVKVVPIHIRGLLWTEFAWNRSLLRGNPHPGAIGSDFNRLGLDIWADAYAVDGRNERRREVLQELVDWRNAIAHQDFDPVTAGDRPVLRLSKVRAWRSAVGELGRHFDEVAYNYLQGLLGSAPW